MPNTFTAHYSFLKPQVGEDDDAWGGHLNADLDAIDNELWLRVRSDVPQTLTQPLWMTGQPDQPAGYAATNAWVANTLAAYDGTMRRYVDNRIANFMDNYVLPIGTIIMWGGALGSIPYGWGLCNGGVYNGIATPNLSDRFILQAGTYAPGSVGGTHVSVLAAHAHDPAGTVSAGVAGAPIFSAYNIPVNVAPAFYVLAYIMRYVRMQDIWLP